MIDELGGGNEPDDNAVNEGLLRRNALACEEAKGRICRCRCGGTLHGQPHSEDWLQEQIDSIPTEKFNASLKADEIYKELVRNGRR
jgi:hypothetical protein